MEEIGGEERNILNFFHLTWRKEINLSNNPLAALPDEIGEWKMLKSFYLNSVASRKYSLIYHLFKLFPLSPFSPSVDWRVVEFACPTAGRMRSRGETKWKLA